MSQPVYRYLSMSHDEAVNLLNRRRRGEDMSEDLVLKALEMTGDYDPYTAYCQQCGIAELKSNRRLPWTK